ncbi:Alkaline phosphatase D [Neolecta irregularis DAH-3]|uniref:Alkaline phosphatase D n=1 Tax=Neolecta irregularis (strain DAH-3) TaxID=1198029 RepID=A0A1U7LLL1_NEOID|nr:Alkaline phosphatase D [Neolecta irregularis DAH-3]|eukprot:OLL23537.1 Alkaline phosphatase D [Neolecta irregularis DAH-3]
MKASLFLVLPVVYASWLNNLNYLSPSKRHPQFSIEYRHLSKRDLVSFKGSVEFKHGVASGDPLPDAVILWTKVTPATETTETICVEWSIFPEHNPSRIADSGHVLTSFEVDYTVKVEARNLCSLTTYYYKFNVCNTNQTSPIGRTKTVPRTGDHVPQNLKFAVYSCSNYPAGFFNAFGNPARKDSVEYVIHLGDYIYEYKNGDFGDGTNISRIPEPNRECATLSDYRTRLAQHHTDPDLQLSHQQFPWFIIWDDHDIADNSWRAGSANHPENATAYAKYGVSYASRKANAVRAFYEYLPVRQVSLTDTLRIWRTLQIGDLVDIFFLDTRHYAREITDTYDNTEFIAAIADDQSRTLMGQRQEEWFYDGLMMSNATWKVVAQQIVFAEINITEVGYQNYTFDFDGWSGYRSNRDRVLKTLYDAKINNTIILSGDSHANWVSELTWSNNSDYDSSTGEGAIGVEFAGTAVSSPPIVPGASDLLLNFATQKIINTNSNEHLKWAELVQRGYFELEIGYDSSVATYFGLNVTEQTSSEVQTAQFSVLSGENKLQRPFGGVKAGFLRT